MKAFLRKYRTLLIILLLLGLAVGVVLVQRARNAAAQRGIYQTESLALGDLTATVGATGTVRAAQSATLNWQTNGVVSEVLVSLGDRVEAGQVLARLEETSLPQNIILARAELATATRNLQTLLTSDTARANAWLNLVNAQRAYDQALAAYTPGVYTYPAPKDIDQLRTDLDEARADLEQARVDYQTAAPEDQPGALADLQNAQRRVDQLQARLDWYLSGGPVNTTAALAEARYRQAQAALEDARREWERVSGGVPAEDIAAAQARVDAAQATLNLARIAAPFAGTVTDVNPRPGDLVNAGLPAFRIDDLSRLLVEVQVTEVDINSIRVGQPATLTFDAILDREYRGEVIEVGQVGTSVQGVVYFPVTLVLTDADEAVKPGMTAAVNIAVNQLTNVLLVPNRAVRVIEGGQRVVYRLENNQLVQVPITLGASAETYSVVLEGDLAPADLIVLNPPNIFPNDGPPAFVRN